MTLFLIPRDKEFGVSVLIMLTCKSGHGMFEWPGDRFLDKSLVVIHLSGNQVKVSLLIRFFWLLVDDRNLSSTSNEP